jgi:hypothetical protein
VVWNICENDKDEIDRINGGILGMNILQYFGEPKACVCPSLLLWNIHTQHNITLAKK